MSILSDYFALKKSGDPMSKVIIEARKQRREFESAKLNIILQEFYKFLETPAFIELVLQKFPKIKAPEKGKDYFTDADVRRVAMIAFGAVSRQIDPVLKKVESSLPKKGRDYFTEKDVSEIVDKIYKSIRQPKDGEPGITPTREYLMGLIQPLFDERKEQFEAYKREYALKMEAGGSNLPVKSVKDLEKLIEKIASNYVKKNAGYTGGGANFFFDLADVPDKQSKFGAAYSGLAGKVLKVSADEKTLEFVSESGGGGTVETPTGTVDGSNTSFTASATPKWIVADGITYYENAGYTLSGLNITMSVAPSQYIRSIS